MEGKVISIYEAREGMGQSLLAINFAISLSQQLERLIGIADMKFSQNNEVASLLNLGQDKYLNNLLPFAGQLDERIVKGYLLKHSYGVALLPSVPLDFKLENIKPTFISEVIKVINDLYPVTIAVTESDVNERTVAAFDSSSLLFLVVSPYLLSLRQGKNFLERLKSLHFPTGMLKVIVNMCDIKSALSKKVIESYMGQEVFAEIPYDPDGIVVSINESVPVMISQPQSNYSRAVKLLAQSILKEIEKFNKDKSGIFSTATSLSEREKIKATAEISDAGTLSQAKEDILSKLKDKIKKRLIDEFDLKSLDASQPELMRKKVQGKIENILAEEGTEGLSRDERSELVIALIDEVLGLGPLENLLRDDTISEIMVNGTKDIFVEKSGKIYSCEEKFNSNDEIRVVIDRILAPIGRRVDESTPLVDARLSDGSRVNVIIPPLSLIGPTITIRKFTMKKLGVNDLIEIGAVTGEMIEFMRACVQLRKNIVISGGTGSGKTTLLNMLSSFLPPDERIVTIEDSAELRLPQRHVITLESRPASIEGTGEISIRRLVINSLRMRPDRIVVGECRGGEALDMLQAMNTGHDGSLTTIHSNTPKDAINRLATMVVMAGTELPERAIKEQLVGAINIIIQTSRLSDGSRKITQVSEIIGLDGTEVLMQDLFLFKQLGVKDGKVEGKFVPTGKKPTFMEDIKTHGIEFDETVFRI